MPTGSEPVIALFNAWSAEAMVSDSIHKNQGATKDDLLGGELIAFLLEEVAAAQVKGASAQKH